MKILYFLVFLLAVILLIFGIFFFLDFNSQKVEQTKSYESNMTVNLSGNSEQFYPYMRYRNSEISYAIDPICDSKKEREIREAFEILANQTILRFYPSRDNPEIMILCSDIAPTPEDEGHFVAGEGGPTEIINSSRYSVIFAGKISLYRDETCEKPQIALHEILHALGFEHNSNQNSILYPVTSCKQELDRYIIDRINELYSVNSLPDLVLENISVRKAGKYVDFNLSVANYGLKDENGVKLLIKSEDKKIKEFDMGLLEIGTKKFLSVQNLLVSNNIQSISFQIYGPDNEISADNNQVIIALDE